MGLRIREGGYWLGVASGVYAIVPTPGGGAAFATSSSSGQASCVVLCESAACILCCVNSTPYSNKRPRALKCETTSHNIMPPNPFFDNNNNPYDKTNGVSSSEPLRASLPFLQATFKVRHAHGAPLLLDREPQDIRSRTVLCLRARNTYLPVFVDVCFLPLPVSEASRAIVCAVFGKEVILLMKHQRKKKDTGACSLVE